jgi:hypothetical protein
VIAQSLKHREHGNRQFRVVWISETWTSEGSTDLEKVRKSKAQLSTLLARCWKGKQVRLFRRCNSSL